ncbi:MAG: hypothetical protein KDA61_14640, partial [Planctomycetales bacterium]|nr:hypothetical protein [Planctomycetales bacterium]
MNSFPNFKSEDASLTRSSRQRPVAASCPIYGCLLAALFAMAQPVATPAAEPPSPPLSSPSDELATLQASCASSSLDELRAAIDPQQDGWSAEVASDRVSQQLNALGQLLASGVEIAPERLASVLEPRITSNALRPRTLRLAYESPTLLVRRGEAISQPSDLDASGFANELGQLAGAFENAGRRQFKFKLYRVDARESQLVTRCYFELTGPCREGTLQQNAQWEMVWTQTQSDPLPRLRSLQVSHYEECLYRSSKSSQMFADATSSVLSRAHECRRQLASGCDRWRSQLEAYLGIFFDGHHGLAIGDVNGDGFD